ncbi:MAG: hypothetical protein KAQ69_12940 [Spirochaetales bacterium]|nr:hypothetical protein [Spirochaetales bacterium]
MKTKKFLGIFVNPVFVQSEGIKKVFDNLENASVQAIAISCNIASPAENGRGRRFPDLARDGYKRLLARPVWGKYEIRLKYFSAYDHNLQLYDGLPYRPVSKNVPSGVDREVPDAMIEEAKKRGMQVYIMIHPLIPPDTLAKDQPVFIDGSNPKPPQYIFKPWACVNSPDAGGYGLALIKDVLLHYPSVDGLMLDFVEYSAYSLEDNFACFCKHCEARAREKGFDWNIIRSEVNSFWKWLHSLTSDELKHSLCIIRSPSRTLERLIHSPGWLQFLQFKAESVVAFYKQVRKQLNEMEMQELTLSARGGPPPWNRTSGMDYRNLSEICDTIMPKLFTFAYSALPRWFGQTIQAWNPGLSESDILDTVVEWMDLSDDIKQRTFSSYHIPGKDESNPVIIKDFNNRLEEVIDQMRGNALCHPFAHAYMTDSEWRQMVAMLRDSSVDGMWIQMYGYLSDQKFKILGELWY